MAKVMQQIDIISVKIALWSNWIVNSELEESDVLHIKKLFSQDLMFEAWEYLNEKLDSKLYDETNLDTEEFVTVAKNNFQPTVEFNVNDKVIWNNLCSVMPDLTNMTVEEAFNKGFLMGKASGDKPPEADQ